MSVYPRQAVVDGQITLLDVSRAILDLEDEDWPTRPCPLQPLEVSGIFNELATTFHHRMPSKATKASLETLRVV